MARTLYVYYAESCMDYEPSTDLGIWAHRADAKKACQEHFDNGDVTKPLAWQNSGIKIARAKGRYHTEKYYVTRRPVYQTFKPTKR